MDLLLYMCAYVIDEWNEEDDDDDEEEDMNYLTESLYCLSERDEKQTDRPKLKITRGEDLIAQNEKLLFVDMFIVAMC